MERRALGRGLASLIGARPARQQEVRPTEPEKISSGVQMIPISQILPNPFQPRKGFDGERLGELAQSIREKGVLLPLIVSKKNGDYELISGERRLRGATMAGLKEVPVLVREAASGERLELALIENLQREDLNPMEEAAGYQLLIDQFKYTQEQVAERVGKDRATVANLLRLLKLPTKVGEALAAGKITMGHARALLAVQEVERQLYFLAKVVEEGWSVRELERRVAPGRRVAASPRMRSLKPLSPQIIRILDELRRALGTQVRLIPSLARKGGSGNQGKILIDYYSEDDLDRIYRVIVGKG